MMNHPTSSHIKTLIPVRIQRLLNHAGGVRLFCIDGNDSEGVREAEHITLGETIGSDH